MSFVDKVIWSEGMFLKPHHFQQHDRYLEAQITDRPGMVEADYWGITHLEVDEALLLQGKFSITSCRGILPDGTAFALPSKDLTPKPLTVPPGTVNKIVYLCLPIRRAGVPEGCYAPDENNYRYRIETTEVCDNNIGSDSSAPIQIGRLALSLKLEDDDRDAFTCLGLAEILETHADESIHLNKNYLPPCLDSHAVPPLVNLLNELKGLLHSRGSLIVEQLQDTNGGGVAEIADFLLLQVINRYEPLITHLSESKGLHPKQLYSILLQLMGELSTFNSKQRRPIVPPIYLHHHLREIFATIISELHYFLSLVREESAIPVRIDHQQLGTWTANLRDKSLLKQCYFVLAVFASVPHESIRHLFPVHTKIAPTEQIKNLVNRSLPGIDLQALPVAPREIPYHSNYCYFTLNKGHVLFDQLDQSAAISFHVAGDFPDLKLELWAIKE